MQRNANSASKSEKLLQAPPPESLRAFVRLLGREAARAFLESAGTVDPDSPTGIAPAMPAADSDS